MNKKSVWNRMLLPFKHGTLNPELELLEDGLAFIEHPLGLLPKVCNLS